ncbi:MAG: type II/IV secretion system ATPase subunit [Anaerolineae bacterium]
MAHSVLPFTPVIAAGYAHPRGACPLQGKLPAELQEAASSNSFLDEYLHQLPLDEIGVPEFYAKPSRELQKLPRRNLIYPIKDGLFVHIYPDASGERDYYISVEPDLALDIEELLGIVEGRLLEYAEEIGRVDSEELKRQVIVDLVDRICTVENPNGNRKIQVSPRQLEGIKYHVLREKVGMGALQPLLQDPYIEDISCSGIGPVFVEHKVFKSLQCGMTFSSHDDLDDFVVWMGEWIKRPVTVRNPIVDAVLPDGSRINIVYGREIAKRGSNFTIRKFNETPISVLELIEYGSLDYIMAAYLSLILEDGMNLFVVGATASGKTTLLNAITTFILPDAKIVTIEDTPEVQTPHKNWVREVTRGMGREDSGGEVNMFDLLKAALRQRPDRIIVGEIRGEEGRIAFQAMQTGHGVMSTFHAASVEKLIQRLTGDPINVPKTYIDNLNVAVVQSAVRAPDGRMVRRVLSVNEIIGYDTVSETFSFIEVFRWNPATDVFEFPGYMNSYLLEQRIAPKRGIPPNKRKAIYTELNRRAKIFERLHKEKHVRSFNEFFDILAEAHRQKLI